MSLSLLKMSHLASLKQTTKLASSHRWLSWPPTPSCQLFAMPHPFQKENQDARESANC